MRTYEGQNPNKIYKKVISDILIHGDKVAPRGKVTLEVQPAVHHIIFPEKRLCSVPGRKANPFFNLAENLWIIAGRGNSEWVSSFNSKLNEFQLDEGHTEYNAPYGRRIRFANKHRKEELTLNKINFFNMDKVQQVDQLLHCYLSLKKDPDSRQAVVSLWNPLIDYVNHETKDRPCNTTIYFKIRKNELNMTVCNRSNDVHLGLYGVNFVQFSMIQEFLAASLNVGIGKYTHLSDSLHIYEDSQHTKNILESDYDFDIYDIVKPKILTYDLFKDEYMVHNEKAIEPNLGDFLSIADEVIDESINFRKNGFSEVVQRCRTDYSLNCFRYLTAYDYYKQGKYDSCWQNLKAVYDYGFKDWAILGLEFCMRNEKFNRYAGDRFNLPEFLGPFIEKHHVSHVLQYLNNH